MSMSFKLRHEGQFSGENFYQFRLMIEHFQPCFVPHFGLW